MPSLSWVGRCFGRSALIAVVLAGLATSAAFGASYAPKDVPSESETAQPVRELPELRTETSDTYLLSDGTRSQKIASIPLNFPAEGGGWQPIEDQLVQAEDGSWQPQASPVAISLPASLGSGPVSVGPSDRRVSFQLQGAARTEGAPAGPLRTYPEALPSTDVTYAATPESVRETLTLKSADAPSIYRYNLSLSEGLRAATGSDGRIEIDGADGKPVYWIGAPTATDSAPERPFPSQDSVHYELSGDGSTLTLTLDKAWLNDPERVFPVTIDPEVYFKEAPACPIISNSHANSHECGSHLYVGPDGATPKNVARSMLYFNTTVIPKGSVIVKSSLRMFFAWDTTTSPITVEARALTRGFTTGATWNKYDGTNAWTTPGGDLLKTPAGETVVNNSEVGKELHFGFTPQLEQWVRDPTSNYGILLKAKNETVAGYDSFAQAGNSEHAPEPSLEVIYEPRMGIPPMGAVYQQAIGNRGTISVNVANGNLSVQNPDVGYDTEGYATELGRSYNSQDDLLVGASIGNWRLNKGEDTKLYVAPWDGSIDFYQPDGGDTRFDRAPWADGHPAAGDRAFTGEAGFNEGLAEHEGGTRSLTIPGGLEWQFDKAGLPTEVKDFNAEGNTLSFTYSAERLSQLKDTHGHTITVTRDPTTHDVTKIDGKTGESWKYAYKEGRLVTVTYPSKEKTKYTYYKTSGLLESIADESGTRVVVYDAQGRVASLRKLVNGTVKKAGSEDEITSLSYGEESTVVAQPGGITDSYYYDQFGNATEETATQEAAVAAYAAYSEIETTAARKDVDLQDHASILDSQLSQQLGEAYTGEWFDPGTGRVKLGITSEGYERTAEQDLDNLGLADNVDIVTTSVTPSALLAEADSLETTLSELVSAGKVKLGVRLSSNAVLIEEANTLSPSQEAAVASAVASAKTPVVVEKRPLKSLATTEDAEECSSAVCAPPVLRGGVSMQNKYGKPGETGTTFCTVGFIAETPHTSARYVLTAGHCIADSEGEPEGGVGGSWQSDSYEVGKAAYYVHGPEHHLAGGATTADRGDEGLVPINPAGEFGKTFRPWVVVYGNSGFKTARNERYPIRGTHFAPKTGAPEQFMVCAGGAPTNEGSLEEAVELKPYQAERCGVTRGFRNVEAGVKHVEAFWQCDPTNTSGLAGGASGSPVYKGGLAFGIYVSSIKELNGCEGYYEGINTIQGVFHVTILRAG